MAKWKELPPSPEAKEHEQMADRIKELEAKLAEMTGTMQGVRMLMLEERFRAAFNYLDATLADLKGEDRG